MSTPEDRRKNLTPLQKLIILHLAYNDPKTINKTAQDLGQHYKSSWIAFNTLTQKELIKKTDLTVKWLNREYPRFWLTQAGMFTALVEGVKSSNLLRTTVKVYPDEKKLQCSLDLASLLTPEGLKIALSTIQDEGKLDDSDIIKIFRAHSQRNVTIQQFIQILRKYPEQYQRTKKEINEAIKSLTKLQSML